MGFLDETELAREEIAAVAGGGSWCCSPINQSIEQSNEEMQRRRKETNDLGRLGQLGLRWLAWVWYNLVWFAEEYDYFLYFCVEKKDRR
jgi:hypothetical protein